MELPSFSRPSPTLHEVTKKKKKKKKSHFKNNKAANVLKKFHRPISDHNPTKSDFDS